MDPTQGNSLAVFKSLPVLSTEESSEPGRLCGTRSDDAVLIQESNETVVWLSPQSVIAKVATPADSAEGLIREHEVAGR